MSEAQLVIAKSMSEKDLSDNIVSLARMLGYLVHRDPTWRATGTDAGYPDLTLLSKRGRLLFAELKAEKGKTTEAQDEWRQRLITAGHFYAIWRPSDWLQGSVEGWLKRNG